jgi:NADPH:quinone reductase
LTHGHVVRIEACGDPSVLKWEAVDVPDPGPDETLVRNRAIGLNFMDVQLRAGHYQSKLPLVLGGEGVGVIEAVGPGVRKFAVGDRVGYIDPPGAYAELLIRPAARLIKLPDWLDDAQAAGVLLKGMTAEYLIRRAHRVTPDQTILVHAAAGGVGQLLCQWARGIGATVIGTVGRRDKVAIARSAGCAHVIVTSDEDLVARVQEITAGQRARVVYDGVGASTFRQSLDCLAPFGLMVLFGIVSGPVPPFEPQTLAAKGSLFLTWPGLFQYTASTQLLHDSAEALFHAMKSGLIHVNVGRTYALRDAAIAHTELEARNLSGSTVLIP